MKSDNELKKTFLNLPDEKQDRVVTEIGKLLDQIKADWQSKPENVGKDISYSDLWKLYGSKSDDGDKHDG